MSILHTRQAVLSIGPRLPCRAAPASSQLAHSSFAGQRGWAALSAGLCPLCLSAPASSQLAHLSFAGQLGRAALSVGLCPLCLSAPASSRFLSSRLRHRRFLQPAAGAFDFQHCTRRSSAPLPPTLCRGPPAFPAALSISTSRSLARGQACTDRPGPRPSRSSRRQVTAPGAPLQRSGISARKASLKRPYLPLQRGEISAAESASRWQVLLRFRAAGCAYAKSSAFQTAQRIGTARRAPEQRGCCICSAQRRLPEAVLRPPHMVPRSASIPRGAQQSDPSTAANLPPLR